MSRRLLRFASLSLAALVPSCSDGDARHATPVAPVVVVGVDGLDWDVARPLVASGRMPHLERLMRRGAFGRCTTAQPTLSPILWTTIATGKRPEEHGIRGFARECHGGLCPFTSSEREGRALWNVADRYGLTSAVFGWWVTWPVEPVRGVMVAGSTSEALFDENAKPALLPGIGDQVHPRALEDRVFAIAERAGAPERVNAIAEERLFAGVRDEDLGRVERMLVRQTMWSVQSDLTFLETALDVLTDHPADLTLLYLGTPDVVGHRFWRYHEPEPFRWPHDPDVQARWEAEHPEQGPLADRFANADGERALARVVPESYAWFDELLGRLVERVGEDVTLVVVSDHGMHAAFTDFPDPDGRWNSGHHLDAPPGVVVAAGPGIRRSGEVDAFVAGAAPERLADVASIAPTLLALLGIPNARDLGRQAETGLLEGAALENARLPLLDTHDDGFRAPHAAPMPERLRESFLDRYRDLGYIGEDPPSPPLEDDDGRDGGPAKR